AILKYHLPFAAAEMLAITVDFLQHAHELKLDYSVRDGINLLRFAIKRLAQDPQHPVGQDVAWREALMACLGDDVLDLQALADRRRRTLGSDTVPLGLGDFFFDSDDPLHPDRQADDDDDDDDDDTLNEELSDSLGDFDDDDLEDLDDLSDEDDDSNDPQNPRRR
ncbi:MAG: hypothetical protein ACKPEY_14665, partial [Planctomycetota bacterium]